MKLIKIKNLVDELVAQGYGDAECVLCQLDRRCNEISIIEVGTKSNSNNKVITFNSDYLLTKKHYPKEKI